MQRVDERVGGIVAQQGLETRGQDLLDVDDGREPHPELHRDHERLTDVTQEDVERAEDEAEPEPEPLEEDQDPGHPQPGQATGTHR